MESDQDSAKNEALAMQAKLAAKRAMKNPAEGIEMQPNNRLSC